MRRIQGRERLLPRVLKNIFITFTDYTDSPLHRSPSKFWLHFATEVLWLGSILIIQVSCGLSITFIFVNYLNHGIVSVNIRRKNYEAYLTNFVHVGYYTHVHEPSHTYMRFPKRGSKGLKEESSGYDRSCIIDWKLTPGDRSW